MRAQFLRETHGLRGAPLSRLRQAEGEERDVLPRLGDVRLRHGGGEHLLPHARRCPCLAFCWRSRS